MPEGRIAITFANTRLTLLPERAIHWHERGALVVADVHLGKERGMRRHGLPIPGDDSGDDLKRLEALLERESCRELIVLGDLVHSRDGWDEDLAARADAALRSWSASVSIVVGNHDRPVLGALSRLPVRLLPEVVRMDGLRLTHEPASGEEPTLCGHVHPVIRMAARGDRLRLPCFHQSGGTLLLPAFGAFTGGAEIRPRPHDRIWAIGEGAVLPL